MLKNEKLLKKEIGELLEAAKIGFQSKNGKVQGILHILLTGATVLRISSKKKSETVLLKNLWKF